jgi:HNH endonuclease
MAAKIYAPRGSTLEERLDFRSEPRIPGRCQLWLGGKVGGGYGTLKWEGRMSLVTRLTWEVERGPIPPGMQVLHRCDNPPCRNIEHLFLGTPADNSADMVAKGRQSRQGAPLGEDHGNAKLTEIEVLEIRAISAGVPQREIAALYGVSRETVSGIRLRRRWKHL